MVGWLPGGSAGTSFCKGTEMSISLRAMAPLPFCLLLSGLDIEQFGRGAPEDIGLFVVAQRRGCKNMVDRLRLPGIGIVAADDDLAGADLSHEMADGLGRKDQRIKIDLPEIVGRLLLKLDV